MSNAKMFKIRVKEEELEGWKKKAGEEGKSLSEWVRERCEMEIVDLTREDKESEGEEKKEGRKVATCRHGVKKGWNCWQCQGLAKVGG